MKILLMKTSVTPEPEWVLHYNVQCKDNGCLSKHIRRQLEDMGVTHHRLGHTY